MTIEEIDVEELEQRRGAGVALVDVRQPDEYEEAHVPGAVLIPLPELPDRLDEVPGDGTLLICRSGGRSMRAAEFLAGKGIAAVNVAGGMLAWTAADKPVATGPETG